jgi:peptide chain release factor 1
MFDKLQSIEAKYEQMTAEMADPAVQADNTKFRALSKGVADMQELVDRFRDYKDIVARVASTEEMLKDPDMRELAQEEMNDLTQRRDALLAEIKVLLVPKDPNDAKNIILEIRGGTGGDEAALFASDLFRMYNRYAERNNWKVEVLSLSESGVGGIKEVIAIISGKNVYSRLKYESGVHRVQRVPATEASGRIHTSTATVAIMPRRRKWTSRSTKRICGSTPSARAVRAARASTPPTRRCASRTSPPTRWCRSRTRSRRSRTARRR